MNANKLPVNVILNKSYRVDACLGEGGFGITYMGFDLNLQKKVAIKEFFLAGYCSRNGQSFEVVPGEGVKGQIFHSEKNRFIEEARILAKIDEHPGIVKVINYFEENGTAYIIMEFIEGKSLKAYIKEKGGVLSTDEALSLMEPVIKALAAVHDKGIVHRDISPDNIMLTSSGRVKLIDFGAAKSKETDMNANKVFKKSYSPIEQCSKEGVIGTYSDIYALCASLYEMITGTKTPSSMERVRLDTLVPPSARGVYISPVCDAAIMNGLTLNPEERIKNATDLYYFLYVYGRDVNATPEGIKKKIKDSSTKVILQKIQAESDRRKNKRNITIALIIIAVLGCGIILVRKLTSSDNQDSTPISITNERGEKDTDITKEDLVAYRDELYDYINDERQAEGINKMRVSSSFEEVCNACIEELINFNASTTAKWNEEITTCVTEEMKNQGISNAGWLVLPYNSDVTIEQIYEDATANIEAINGNITGAIDLMNCGEVGISLGMHSDGTIFFIIIYR